jgi:hypothetical protein
MKMPALSKLLLLSATLLAGGSLALLTGCKGNTSAAAMVERTVTPPPMIQAYQLTSGQPIADPVTAPVWSSARWLPLVAPANTDRTTAPVSAAVLYDAKYLYIAFISDKPATSLTMDTVSIYLDSSIAGTGADMLNLTLSPNGAVTTAWLRDAEPPTKPRDDGSPDLFHPVSRIPDITIPGLIAKTFDSVQNNKPVWTAVVAIPLKGLPLPLRSAPLAGANWKLNLLRTTLLPDTGAGVEQRQANLSPVYVGSQAVCPYRMASLTLAPAQISALPIIPTNHS